MSEVCSRIENHNSKLELEQSSIIRNETDMEDHDNDEEEMEEE